MEFNHNPKHFLLSLFFTKYKNELEIVYYTLPKNIDLESRELFKIYENDTLYLESHNIKKTPFEANILPNKSFFAIDYFLKDPYQSYYEPHENSYYKHIIVFNNGDLNFFLEIKDNFDFNSLCNFLINTSIQENTEINFSNMLSIQNYDFSALKNNFHYYSTFTEEEATFLIPSINKRFSSTDFSFYEKLIVDYFKCFFNKKNSAINVSYDISPVVSHPPVLFNGTLYQYTFTIRFKDSFKTKSNTLSNEDILSLLPKRSYFPLPNKPHITRFDNKNDNFYHSHFLISDNNGKPFFVIVLSLNNNNVIEEIISNNSTIRNEKLIGKKI